MPFGASPQRFALMARLTIGVPAYRLELGRDIDAIAPRLGELLDSLE
jgi:hypothetical protein